MMPPYFFFLKFSWSRLFWSSYPGRSWRLSEFLGGSCLCISLTVRSYPRRFPPPTWFFLDRAFTFVVFVPRGSSPSAPRADPRPPLVCQYPPVPTAELDDLGL